MMDRRRLMFFLSLLLLAASCSEAYHVGFVHPPWSLLTGSSSSNARTARSAAVEWSAPGASTTRLYASAESGGGDDAEVDTTEEIVSEEDEVEKEEEEEDPELVALKAEIAALESDLKDKRRAAQTAADQADEYSKSGYARKVAEMENMRKARTMLQSSNKFSAAAAVLGDFLPVLDKVKELRDAYADDDFGKQYGAINGALETAMTNLGVDEYMANAGDDVDKSRVAVVESEYSDDYPTGAVLRPVSPGLELKGNVIRMAECVASLGSEADAKAAAEAEAKAAEAAAAAAAEEEAEDDEEGGEEQGEG